MTLQRSAHRPERLLRHNQHTGPAGSDGKLMGECCCYCFQWAIDWVYICAGGCVNGIWTDGVNGVGSGDSHYTTSSWSGPGVQYYFGQNILYSGTKYVCIESHISGSSFDSSKWTSVSGWFAYNPGNLQPSYTNPRQILTDLAAGATPPTPGLSCGSTMPVLNNPADPFSAINGGCTGTRYGPYHIGERVPVDVDLSQPTDCDLSSCSAHCGGCYNCYSPGTRCYDDSTAPYVHPCSVNVSFSGTCNGNPFSASEIIPLVRCYSPGIYYIWTPSSPPGPGQLQSLSLSQRIAAPFTSPFAPNCWILNVGFAANFPIPATAFSLIKLGCTCSGMNEQSPCTPIGSYPCTDVNPGCGYTHRSCNTCVDGSGSGVVVASATVTSNDPCT